MPFTLETSVVWLCLLPAARSCHGTGWHKGGGQPPPCHSPWGVTRWDSHRWVPGDSIGHHGDAASLPNTREAGAQPLVQRNLFSLCLKGCLVPCCFAFLCFQLHR